jgi:hypothetical protein
VLSFSNQAILQLSKFTIKTRKSTFLVPSTYNFHIEIEYEINGKVNHDAVKQQFTIRTPLRGVIQSGALGSIIGTSIKILADKNDVSALFKATAASAIVLNVLLATVLIVAFARKKDAQPFITIEDFWGGFFAGFVAGYLGIAVLNKIAVFS